MRKYKEKIMGGVFFTAALTSILAVLLICVFLFANGIPAMGKVGLFKFLAGTNWAPTDSPASFGIFPMILGSIYVTAGAIVIGVPVGILTSIFMSRYCPKPLYKILKPATELLAGIPSIVYGFFGLVVLVPFVKTVFGVSESAIRSVPESYYEGALALGATKERSIFTVILPAAKSGILAGVILGIGRAIGETMAVIMVAGNQARIPSSILKGVRTLTSNIVIEMGYAADLHREVLIATGVVLFVFILLINISFSIVKGRNKQ